MSFRTTSLALILLALASSKAVAAEDPSSTERSVFVAERIAREYMARKHVSGVAIAVAASFAVLVHGGTGLKPLWMQIRCS